MHPDPDIAASLGDGERELIRFFDDLLVGDLTLDRLLRRVAAHLSCEVGVKASDAPSGRLSVNGEPSRGGTPGPSAMTLIGTSGDTVWLQRGTEPPRANDELALERLGVTASVLARSTSANPSVFSESALVEVAISATADRADRARCLRALGFDAAGTVRVMAFVGEADADGRFVKHVRESGARAHSAELGDVRAVVVQGGMALGWDVPAGCRLAVGSGVPASSAVNSWQEAEVALQFALPSTHDHGPYGLEEAVGVDAAQVGCFGLLARYVPRDEISATAEVAALDRLAADPGGPELLRTLEAVAATESVRRAAAMIHLHHNSVRHRIERAEKDLGFSVTEPYGRVRLMTALTLRRLRDAK